MKRRTFLRASLTAAGGLVIGCGTSALAPTKAPSDGRRRSGGGTGPALNAWIAIEPDDRVVLTIAESEMGQGVLTALAMALADELDVDWERVTVRHAPADEAAYGRQSTGGSTSVRRGVQTMREVGAAARAMLVAAAAARFGVDPSTLQATNGVVEGSGQRVTYGEIAADAAKIAPRSEVTLKEAAELRYLGRSMPRLDIPEKVDGSSRFGIDVSVDDMVYASVEHCPIFGGTLGGVDDAAAREVPGVIDVVTVPTGVAVVATDTWAAFQGRQALKVTWKGDTSLDTAAVRARCEAVLDRGKVARDDGDVEGALVAASTIDAVYEAPYLAHSAMEPLNCTVALAEGAADVWVSTQTPTGTVKAVAKITGLPETAIRVHTAMLGGGFGRRSQTDFVEDAVHVAKAIGRPVKVTWKREDDVQGGWYRPFVLNRLRGAMSADGTVAWWHQIAGSYIRGYEGPALEGAANVPYRLEHCRVSSADPDLPVSVWWWRSVGSSQNAWVTECFFDELCRAAGQDPLQARLERLAGEPRMKAVLTAATAKAGYGGPLAEGHAHGIAVHESFGSIVAQVAEVSIADGRPRVHRVVCAVDCGQVVNPDTIAAQMEGGIVYGLTAALHGEVPLSGGRAVPSNFVDYPALTIDEMPVIETVLVPDGSAWGGVGEPGTPPIAPAVCNALLALTGKPVRRLPIRLA
ncbi:MAG: molybdopterin cofactor-binding domain-containing protein [Myxococcota bacterium]